MLERHLEMPFWPFKSHARVFTKSVSVSFPWAARHAASPFQDKNLHGCREIQQRYEAEDHFLPSGITQRLKLPSANSAASTDQLNGIFGAGASVLKGLSGVKFNF
jgi:hypothetical protein